MNPIDLIRGAQLPEATLDLCLRGDLQAEFEQGERELAEAQQQRLVVDSLAAGGGLRAAAEKLERLREQMREHSLTVRLRAMPRLKFRALAEAHPPRIGPDGAALDTDRHMGVNADTFPRALIRECLVAPTLDNETLTALLDEHLTDWQHEALLAAAWNLNRREVSVPFSRAASRILSSEPE